MSTDAFEQLIDVAAPGGGSYPVQRGHRRGVRSPHTFDAARWPPSSLTSPYAPQGSTTAVLAGSAADHRGPPTVAGQRLSTEHDQHAGSGCSAAGQASANEHGTGLVERSATSRPGRGSPACKA